jgi:hypothetical protein
MADDDRGRSSPSVTLLGWLVLGLAALTAYLGWQIAPLTARIDALERDRLAVRDEMLSEMDHLGVQIAALQASAPAEPQPGKPLPKSTSVPEASARPAAPDIASPPSAAKTAAAPSPQALEFLDRHLFPADAVIARLMVGSASPDNIARLTNHSRAYVLARGMQIEKLVSAAPGAPPEITRALRQFVRENAPAR